MELLTFYILAIIFLASLVRSTFGFGESLIAVPLLIFWIPMEEAVPLSVLVSILIAAVVVVQDRKQVHFKSAKWLILYAIMGIPIGLLLLLYGNESVVKLGLGILIILYSIFSLVSKDNLKIESNNKVWLFVCGLLSGILGGAYGINGPPLVVYGSMRKWNAKHFRATLQAYFLPTSTLGMIGYWYSDLLSLAVLKYFVLSIPVIIPAIFLGRYFNLRFKDNTFLKYIFFGLILVGLLLLSQSLARI